ncbi:MAG: transcription-repair coupling factor [Opitutales bacterium]|nr:transcription-repair coupling factor [Opitutales bacterium]
MKTARIPDGADCHVWTGVVRAFAPALVEELSARSSNAVTVVFLRDLAHAESDAAAVNAFAAHLRGTGPEPEVLILPEPPEADDDSPRATERAYDRMAALTRLADYAERKPPGQRLVILTNPRAFFAPVPERTRLRGRGLKLARGAEADFTKLREALAALDYDEEAVCEYPGQFAVRGGLVDIYPVNAEAPVRVDFFGDEIEAIRVIDPTTQRSEGAVDAVTVAPRRADFAANRPEHIFDYFSGGTDWIFDEPESLAEAFPGHAQHFERLKDRGTGLQALFTSRASAPDAYHLFCELEVPGDLAPPSPVVHNLRTEGLEVYRARPLEERIGYERIEDERAARLAFLQQLAAWEEAGETVFVVAHNTGEADRFREIIGEEPKLKTFAPKVIIAPLRAGFRAAPGDDAPLPLSWPAADGARALTLVSDAEIFGRYRSRPAAFRRRRVPVRSQVDHLLDFSELADGDYLVHLSHGVCIYRGLSTMEIRGKKEEVISLEFADSITLHVPLYESHLLTRYVGLSKVSPRLGRLGSNAWEKSRRSAEEATLDFAAKLLQAQASRLHGGGHSFRPDTDWQHAFEDTFLFEETRDQRQAILDAKSDMEKSAPMDRLVCGDVGFGKTEVALRAAFKAVMEGKQVAVLVPTTVLAQQHFTTFRERLADFPVTVEMLSRFRSKREQNAITKQLAEGRIDIVVGTHRILGHDVLFKDLGLLVIDEEHRFGVRHKEKLKEVKHNVDVLSMSATPIPRTLYLALMGARDMSVIETPPADRLPIETIVRAYDPETARRAIEEELARGGQVFYLHNRVQSIETVAARVEELVPRARVAVGHGQMTEAALEKVMTRFVAGEFDVLVCTTIIENGLDIPNCNTIIIEGADRFGLSQLYQLRGRVGRFNRQAYAYLLLHRHTRLLDLARKRLSAMRQHNQLGAGFRIAMRDLELRGSGNLLGPQQSGHIASVGFELYCQLLRQSVARLKGEKVATHVRATVNLDFVSVGEGTMAREARSDGFSALKDVELEAGRIPVVEAHLPVAYIAETRLRIDFYRRLAMAATVAEVDETGAALADRFGKPPRPAEILLRVTRIRARAEEAGLIAVETEGNRLKVLRASGKRDDYVKIGGRFPRLTQRGALRRLREIEQFVDRQRPKHPTP